jgi:hypothetical protein
MGRQCCIQHHMFVMPLNAWLTFYQASLTKKKHNTDEFRKKYESTMKYLKEKHSGDSSSSIPKCSSFKGNRHLWLALTTHWPPCELALDTCASFHMCPNRNAFLTCKAAVWIKELAASRGPEARSAPRSPKQKRKSFPKRYTSYSTALVAYERSFSE